jgi:hypothetical protein
METPRLTSIPAKSPQTASQVIDREAVVLDIPAKMLRGFNPVGSRVWQLVDGQRTLEEIARVIVQEFAGREDDVVRDVQAFLGELADKKLVVFP